MLIGCESDTTTPGASNRPEQVASYVAIYFENEKRLVPEYHPLPEGEPERALWDLLVAGPDDPALDSALSAAMELEQAAEPDEGRLLLEPSDAFWEASAPVRRRAAAQIVFTMGNLEEGREVTLIDDLRPGRIEDADGNPVAQPLTRETFGPPLIQVSQPVAGAAVARTIPIDLSLSPRRPVAVSLETEEGTVATTVIRDGTGELAVNQAPPGTATVAMELEPGLTVEVPVRLSPPRKGS
ncbi:MAG: hypothetical protein M3198_10990 [Actinomycetota bacterium]|nr:hypothetical protein [Actinomycetota bacterium]